MSQPCPEVVSGAVEEYLGFVFKPAECAAVEDAVAVALEIGPERMCLFRENASTCRHVVYCVRSEIAVFVAVLV